MPQMNSDLPFDLTVNFNRKVFDLVKNTSAHGDLVELLGAAIKPLGDVQTFYPESGTSRPYIVSTNGIVFGFAMGTKTIAFRLDRQMKERALATGGNLRLEFGSDWVSFEPFRCDWPEADFKFWARKAYVYARETQIVK